LVDQFVINFLIAIISN